MNRAKIHVYGSLTDHTGCASDEISFFLNPSVKDIIESHGVPHVEVFGLKVNKKLVQLSHNIKDGDHIEVFPNPNSGSETFPSNIRTPDQMPIRFIADVHLGKTARNLRLMGFDTLYNNKAEDNDIVKRSVDENRSVLTRDLGLLKNGNLKFGYWLRSTDPFEQTLEVISFFGLNGQSRPFKRCLECNGQLVDVKKKEVVDDIPPQVAGSFDEFKQCAECHRIYWKGSHFQKLLRRVREFEASAG
jgi:hypothetical protein